MNPSPRSDSPEVTPEVTPEAVAARHVAPDLPETSGAPDDGAAAGAGEDLPDLLKIPTVAKAVWLRVLLFAGGLVCMALGVAGWLLPVVTGIPFYILGFVLLGMAHPPLGHWLNRKERRLSPRIRMLLRPRLRRERKAAASQASGSGTEAGTEPGTGPGSRSDLEA